MRAAGALIAIGLVASTLWMVDRLWDPGRLEWTTGILLLLVLGASGLLPAAMLGGVAGWLCSLGVPAGPRAVNIGVAAAVAVIAELRLRLTPRAGAAAVALARAVRSDGPGPAVRAVLHRPPAAEPDRHTADPPGPDRHTADPPGTESRRDRLRRVVASTLAGPVAGTGLDAEDRQTLLREGQLLLSVVAATLYGASWLAAQWFYGSLGVTPEEVGLSTVDLLLIAGVVALLFALAVLALDALWRRVRHPVLRIPVFAMLGGGLAALFAPWPVAVLYALAGAVVAAISASTTDRPAGRPLWWMAVAAVVVVAGLGAAAYLTSDAMRDRVDRGAAAMPTLLDFQIAALWAPTTQVWPVGDAVLPAGLPGGSCVHRLGNADGVTVLYRDGVVFRVPAESVLSRSCEPS